MLSRLLISLGLGSTLSVVVLAQPFHTPVQQQILAQALAEAVPASDKAASTVLQLIDLPATRKYLQEFDDGTALHKLPADQLADMFWKAVSAAELVHSFGDTNRLSANCGFDLTLDVATQAPVFWNQWQLQSLGYVPTDTSNNRFTESSETKLFDYPPFRNVSQPDLPTSTDRLVYGAVNMYRSSGGNPQCGPVAAILSRSYIQDVDVLAAPMDTGFFTGVCTNDTLIGLFGNETLGYCLAWSNLTLGRPPYLNHMLEPYLKFWNQSTPIVGGDYVSWNLARLLTRALSRQTYLGRPLALNFVENALGYFEFNIPARIDLPKGVKMMVGMFELLWGTEQGSLLRKWCAEQGWPLAWAFNPLMSFWRCGTSGSFPSCTFPPSIFQGIETANARVLDPWVLHNVSAGHNITITSEVIQNFNQFWQTTNVSKLNRTELEVSWQSLSGGYSQLAVEPVFAGGCEAECVGILVKSQQCVCSQ